MSSPSCYCVVLRSAARRLGAEYDAALAPVGINVGQFSLLRRIAHAAPVTLTELGRRTELDRSTIGRNVKVLERMGLVALGQAKDRREAPVLLTAEGLRAIDQGLPLWDGVQKAIDARLGPEGTAALRAALAAL